MGKLIKSDGSFKYVKPKNKENFTLKELQNYVGGHIEIVETKTGRLMVINEEGKLFKLEENKLASQLYKYSGTDIIVGDVLVIKKDQIL